MDPNNAKDVNHVMLKQWTLIITFKVVNDIFRTRIPISKQLFAVKGSTLYPIWLDPDNGIKESADNGKTSSDSS